MNEYSREFLSRMKMFGLLKYDFERIAIIISNDKNEHIDISQFRRDFHNLAHAVYVEYDKGYKTADFAIEKALLDKAITGDVAAIEQLENYKGKREYVIHINKMFDVQV
jgi:hypothetical protein